MLIVKERGFTFTADVTNTTDSDISGKKLTSIMKYFEDSIKSGEVKSINSIISRRLNKNIVKSIEYKLTEA